MIIGKTEKTMKLVPIFFVIFASLILNCQSVPDSSSTDVPTTVITSTDGSTTSDGSGGSTTSENSGDGSSPSSTNGESTATSVSGGPTSSEGSTQSPGTPASTTTGEVQSTTTGETVSTVKGASITSGAPTASGQTTPQQVTTIATQAPTTTQAPLATTQADVWAEFDVDCDSIKGYCVYNISAPQIDADTYNVDNSKLQTDQANFNLASSVASYANKQFKNSEALEKYENVTLMVEELREKMEELRILVDEAKAFVHNETASITETNQTIKAIYSDLTTCYYKSCALATPPPITTTTTPRPTTPNLCSNYNCKNPNFAAGDCFVINGKASCECAGNLNQTGHCETAGCPLSMTGLKPGVVPGPFWSPGFDGKAPPTKSYNSNLNCVYKIISSSPIKVVVNNIKVDATTKITVNANVIPSIIINDKVKLGDYLIRVIKNSTYLDIKFTTGTVLLSGGYYVDWTIN